MQLYDYLKQKHGRASQVARATGFTSSFLSQIARGTRCPAERCADLERACGQEVRRWDLRPNDWHRIWPELIGAEGAPPVPESEPKVA